MKQSPIFVRTYDFISWLIPRTMGFPRSQRFVLTKRLQDAALDFQECILEAGLSRNGKRTQVLQEADIALARIRFYLRLAQDMKWLQPGQYAHAAQMVTEIGRLLGGWRKNDGLSKGPELSETPWGRAE
jgi:hypothetical protein